jgi:acyl-homoserine lactone acylase PvdQ
MRGLIAALGAVFVIAAAPPAQADVQPYAANGAGGFHDVLPPGANGTANGVELAAFLTTGARPAHNDDQLAMYRDLMYATPGLKAQDLGRYYKDATFGVKPGDIASSITPRADVTLLRDNGFGVPHIYGTTRGGTMFGAGYAAAQDRLFFIDVLRHLGRAQLSSFIGGAPSNRAMDAEQWSIAPYTDADYRRQFDLGDDLYGERGRRLQDDALNYVAGVNRYIAEARLDPTKMPGEYAALGRPQGPDDWKVTDLFSTASLVGGIFGKGGGHELAESQLLDAFKRRFGAKKGRTLWEQFAAFDDRDAPTTVQRTRFPYQTKPQQKVKGAEEPPDRGSFIALQVARSPDAPPAGAGLLPGGNLPLPPRAVPGTPPPPGLPLAELAALPKAMSNALLVSGANSASGHPLAVFGPQVAYFAPEILMEEDLHGPGIDAKGAALPGVNMYVQLGHGRDYAWSATCARAPRSAGTDRGSGSASRRTTARRRCR